MTFEILETIGICDLMHYRIIIVFDVTTDLYGFSLHAFAIGVYQHFTAIH